MEITDKEPPRRFHGGGSLAGLPGGLQAGELGVIFGRAGIGKTALLIHISLDRVLRREPVLHIAIRHSVQDVRDHYESLFLGQSSTLRPVEREESLRLIERHRMIHATRGVLPSGERLFQLLDALADVLDFRPKLIVIDEVESLGSDQLRQLQQAAQARQISIWCALTSAEPQDLESVADVAIELLAERGSIFGAWRRPRVDTVPTPFRLDGPPWAGRDHAGPPSEVPIPAGSCVMYSGGAVGSEATFGEVAERFGVREINFTFDGHTQARTRGAHPLTQAEMTAGDVSLAYVSRRLKRTYSEGTMIRRVLQSLWHQVNNAQQVFVIGTIQEDGTVVGGTGWSVELARMWSKPLWVFDQDKGVWFRWSGQQWEAGEPVITASAFCGTGTRYLNNVGRTAIIELFERSFSPA